MKISEIIIEGRSKAAPHVSIIIAHDPLEAEQKFLQANKGQAGKEYDVRSALKKVRDRYGVEIVGDIEDYLGHKGNKVGDDKHSLLANRKKKS